MFENIMKLFKKGNKKEALYASSKEAAKERLHLVLMQDRANVSADFLDLMRKEIIEVIKKYIDIDESAMDVELRNQTNDDGTQGAPALYANIPILNIKNDTKNMFMNDERIAGFSKNNDVQNNKRSEFHRHEILEQKQKETEEDAIQYKKETIKDIMQDKKEIRKDLIQDTKKLAKDIIQDEKEFAKDTIKYKEEPEKNIVQDNKEQIKDGLHDKKQAEREIKQGDKESAKDIMLDKKNLTKDVAQDMENPTKVILQKNDELQGNKHGKESNLEKKEEQVANSSENKKKQ